MKMVLLPVTVMEKADGEDNARDRGTVLPSPCFGISNLAKDWKNGTQNPQCGFVLVSDSTTRRTATYAAEYGDPRW